MHRDRRQQLVKIAQESFLEKHRLPVSIGAGILAGGGAVQFAKSLGDDVSIPGVLHNRLSSRGVRLGLTAAAAVPLAAAAYGSLSAWDRYKRRDM